MILTRENCATSDDFRGRNRWRVSFSHILPSPSLQMEGFVEDGLAKSIGVSNFTKVIFAPAFREDPTVKTVSHGYV